MDKNLMAFYRHLDRSYFMETHKELADVDSAFEIGYGQTISQPSLVCFMTELLHVQKNHRILEIGTGSGYQTAFLAEFGGEVFTVECIEPLLQKAKLRLDAMGYSNIIFTLGDGSVGLPTHGPYDRIIVTAAARMIPSELVEQLAIEGILVIPVGNQSNQDLLVVTKDKHSQVAINSIEKVRFVPLVGKYTI